MNFRSKLKDATAASHRNIENNPRLKSLLSADLTRDRYVEVIGKYYGYWLAFEARLSEIGEIKRRVPAMERRLRSSLLRADLLNLGLGGEAIDRLPRATIPPFKDFDEALGALYVMEGSTMGAAFIKKHLSQLNILEDSQMTYFGDYGPDKMAMWSQFIEVLEKIEDEASQARVIAAAQGSFVSLDRWMRGDD